MLLLVASCAIKQIHDTVMTIVIINISNLNSESNSDYIYNYGQLAGIICFGVMSDFFLRGKRFMTLALGNCFFILINTVIILLNIFIKSPPSAEVDAVNFFIGFVHDGNQFLYTVLCPLLIA